MMLEDFDGKIDKILAIVFPNNVYKKSLLMREKEQEIFTRFNLVMSCKESLIMGQSNDSREQVRDLFSGILKLYFLKL